MTFITQNLTEKTHYIASTGIEGRHADPSVLVQMDSYAVVKKYFEAHYPDLPHLIALAPVCRPGWLIETECIAVVPTESSFKPL